MKDDVLSSSVSEVISTMTSKSTNPPLLIFKMFSAFMAKLGEKNETCITDVLSRPLGVYRMCT